MRQFSLYESGMDKAYAFIDDDNSAVMVKVVSGTDPVEMVPDEARAFAAGVLRLADELDRIDEGGARV